jgi:PTH1 family peptidyl-tRNA hydrolase
LKLIVGLGNPGRKYEQTRHNVGFMTAAKLAAKVYADSPKNRFGGEIAEAVIRTEDDKTEKIAILCPTTYMNASGQSVRKAFDFYKLSHDDLLVICDDLNLPTGRLRIRPNGSAGGQKGLADIIRHLDSQSFPRLRIGIDRPPEGWEVTDYVLGKFSSTEKTKIEEATTWAAQAALDWVTHDTAFVANLYNPDPSLSKNQKPKK